MICAEVNLARISFSGDLSPSDITPVEHTPVRRDTTLLDSNSDFEFHICRNFEHDSSPADEIFANGMILPILPCQFQEKVAAPKRLYKYELPAIVSVPSPPPPPLPPLHFKLPENSRKDSGANSDSEAEKSSKSFWSFKRSSSLNCDIKKSLICPFTRVTRSNSAGSVTNSKRAMLKDGHRHSTQRHACSGRGANPSSSHALSPPSSSSLCCKVYQFRPQKHSGKKNGCRGGGNGSLGMNPVLNVPSPFGLGSILRHSKDKKKKLKPIVSNSILCDEN